MNTDRIAGAATDLAGRAQSVAGSVTGDLKLQAEGAVDQIRGTAQNLAGQAKDTLRTAADQASGYASQASDYASQAGDYAQKAYERGRDTYERGRDAIPDSAVHAYRDGRAALSSQVQSSPIGAILVAGAVGYALGWLIHGRS